MEKNKKIPILGSADGSNLKAIVNYFKDKDVTFICLSNLEHSNFLETAKELNLEYKYLPWEENYEYFSSHKFDLIVLSDYRKQVQNNVLELGKFINLQYSLLPSFKGFDAMQRAFSSGVKVSGVTVHWVNEELDGGKIIAQYPVLIGNLTHYDEFENEMNNIANLLYPIVIEKVLKDEVFDFNDLLGSGGCSKGGGCSGCGGCH